MRPALLVAVYAAAVAWQAPALLARLTARGIGARLGVVAWLTAMASVLACAAVSLWFLAKAAVAGWPQLAATLCRSVAGRACTPTVYRSALFELALAAGTAAAALIVAVLAWRYGRSVQRSARATQAHGEAARIAGRAVPRAAATVVLDSPHPAAYCVPGRPPTIVLTRGALNVLEPAQLEAVLAHERAHLAGRHHLLSTLTRALAASLPGVPLFTRGRDAVAGLTEMCADDAAVRLGGRPSLIAALLAMGTGTAVPATALEATSGPVTPRVHRLLEPPRRGRRARYCVALTTVMVLLGTASGLVTAFAVPLAGHGLHLG